MKKHITLVIAILMLISLFAGCNTDNPTVTGTGETGETAETGSETGVGNGAGAGIVRIADTRKLDPFEYTRLNIAGTDDVGRKVTPMDGMRTLDAYVGVWYYFWLGHYPSLQPEIKDMQKLLEMGEEGQAILDDLSDAGQFYYTYEPLYGYYDSRDPYIINKHIELFSQAGVDFLYVDTSNNSSYLDVGNDFLAALEKYQNMGYKVPKVMFFGGGNTNTTMIYNDYYKSGRWDELWFKPNGKPLITGMTENNDMASSGTLWWGSTDFITPTLQRYFEVKEDQFPVGKPNANGMPYMAWEYPQQIYGGYTAITLAQHSHSTTYFSSMHPESHRGYNNITKRVEGDYREGLSFQQMWDSAIERKEQITTMTVFSWNELIVQKQPRDVRVFIDGYGVEYSVDMELAKGYYNDNYYMQMVKGLRDFKYNEPVHYIYELNTMKPDASDAAQWDGVKAHYKDFVDDVSVRDFKNAVGSFNYVDNSGRNDISDIKVTHDKDNLYFQIQTVDSITAYNGTDENWMNILISTDSSDTGAFAGYQYLVNRQPGSGVTTVEKSKGGYVWETAGEAQYDVNGNTMVLSVPLASLGLTSSNCYIEFKVADHVTEYKDIMDYYVTGDSAPLGRLSYCYGY